jgi:pimeloyl-ACP methyl ester carboxylesterase
MMSRHPLILLLSLLALLSTNVRAVEPEPAPPAEAAGEATTAEAPAEVKEPGAEQELATALRAQLKDGEVINLKVGDKEVLALFTAQTRGRELGAVVLLHDLNGHPDWPAVIHPLRRQLPDAGWHTLSLQLPHADSALASVEQLDAIRPRLAEALAELERRAINNVVLIGYGQGALAAIDYLADNLAPAVRGLIVISLDGRANAEPRLDAASGLARVSVPILDIYGTRDNLNVVASAKRRYDMARRNNDNATKPRTSYADIASDYNEKQALNLSYRQVMVNGADHNFSGQTTNLEKRLRGWLQRYAARSAR